jgi:2-polyprenyl-3-methyl-5-hydroxy-6-metoxy-1,4-benzoquinol methylase
MIMNTATFDTDKFEQLQGKVMGDVGGAIGVFMAFLGDQAGVYQVLEKQGPCSHGELASATGLSERYLREWLSANAAFGYVDYNAENDTFSLSPEQAALFAHEGETTCMQGFFQAVVAQYETQETAVDVFKTGRGRPWGEHSACCFCGTDRFFRPGYAANLVDSWIPALNGVDATLRSGGKIADVGCGHGSSSILMAESYPNSSVRGFDFHPPSVETASAKATAGNLPNVEFQVGSADEFPGDDYDLICIFDALHDMGDPVGVARHIRESLKPGGTFMLVEPLAGDSLEENLNLLSGIFYGFSTTICVPTSKAQDVGLALGAQAGQARLTEVLMEAGFSQVRRATETPTNMVLEAIA